jgi:magnesium-transporting ATPase (P-type)
MLATPTRMNERMADQPKPKGGGKNPPNDLGDLLEETRIFLPGTQIFAGFLITLPFTNRFEQLTTFQRDLYITIFLLVFFSIICFIAPAAYHRIARPVHHKQKFKVLATRLLIIGLIPFSLSCILSTYFIVHVVLGPGIALVSGIAATIPIVVVWWLLPLFRAHDAMPDPHEPEEG